MIINKKKNKTKCKKEESIRISIHKERQGKKFKNQISLLHVIIILVSIESFTSENPKLISDTTECEKKSVLLQCEYQANSGYNYSRKDNKSSKHFPFKIEIKKSKDCYRERQKKANINKIKLNQLSKEEGKSLIQQSSNLCFEHLKNIYGSEEFKSKFNPVK